MTAQYLTREGDVTAVDTKTALTTLGSESSPAAAIVESDKREITQVIVGSAADGAAVGSASFILRLEGNGIAGAGGVALTVGAEGGTLATTNQAQAQALVLDTSIPVKPGGTISFFAEMMGADIGTVRIAATLVIE